MSIMTTKKKQYVGIGLLLIGFAAVFLLSQWLGFGCPIQTLTGIPCPGCGMTRAYLALLHLDIPAAFHYHPLFWMLPLGLAVFLIRKGPLANEKVKIILLSLMAAAVLVVYLLRLLVLRGSAIYLFS